MQVPECLTKLNAKRVSAAKKARENLESNLMNPVEKAKEQFEVAAQAGCNLGLRWLQRIEEEEKRLLTESSPIETL